MALASIAARLGFETLEPGDEGSVRAIVRRDTVLALARLDSRLAALEKREARTVAEMTLDQLEAMAARLGAAAKTIRDAQALLNPGTYAAKVQLAEGLAEVPLDPAAAHRLRQLQPVEGGPPRMKLSPAEQADRSRALGQFGARVDDPNLPDEIREMERGT